MGKRTWLFTGALFLSIVVIWLLADRLSGGFAYRANMAEAAASTIAALMAVTLFVERGMAVINAILFGEEQRTAEVQLASANAAALTKLANVLGFKERLRILGAFVAGLFISAAGVRTLEGLLDVKAAGAPQNALLFPVDVVLTAALIAGGSNGLAFLLQLAKDKLAPAPVATVVTTAASGTTTTTIDPTLRSRLATTG
jgi:hypothetical protein